MTLDPVHLDAIATLAGTIHSATEGTDHRSLAEDVWRGALDPLATDDGRLEPLDERERFRAPVEDLGLQAPPTPSVHGLDAGTVNPRTFANGLVLDVAQAAMSATPSDLGVARERTIVTCVHTNDATVDAATDWRGFDGGRGRVVQVPRLARDRLRAVHGLALALAESAHALAHADAVEDLLVLDGPLYPPPVLAVAMERGAAGRRLATEAIGREVCANYARLVERFVENDVPLVGFVKTAESTAVLRALGDLSDPPPTPWADDLAFFTRVLEPGDDARVLTWTNWFVSTLGGDGAFAAERAPPGVDRALEPADYRVAFFVVHDPRVDLSFRVELPYAQARDPAVRERVRKRVLRGVAAEAGPPAAIRKADALARIDRGEKASLLERLERALDTTRTAGYDELRWGLEA
ncbi:MAG: DNA double-strand break repair nuclease NurA [Halobacteriaceae archaeon]